MRRYILLKLFFNIIIVCYFQINQNLKYFFRLNLLAATSTYNLHILLSLSQSLSFLVKKNLNSTKLEIESMLACWTIDAINIIL